MHIEREISGVYLTFTTGGKFGKQPAMLTLRQYMCTLYTLVFAVCRLLDKPLK